MSATLEIESEKFRLELNRLAGLGLEFGRILKVESRRLVKTFINFTPPFKGASRVNQFETIDVNAREQGERAVERDIARVIRPIPDSLLQFLLRNNKVSFPQVFTIWHYGTMKFYKDVEHLGMTVAEVRAFHQKMRSNSSGRTPFFRLTPGMDLREYTGRNKPRIMMACPASVYKAYVKEAKSHVGKMKGGWAVAAQRLGVGLPSWIARHANQAQGDFIDQSGNKQTPFVVLVNRSRGIGDKVPGNIVRQSLEIRAKAIAANVERMIKYGVGQSGDYGYAKA